MYFVDSNENVSFIHELGMQGMQFISTIFQLSENFCTHTRVLNLAQSVVNLLCHFFPLFVDALKPETSRINGDLAMLIENETNDNDIKTIFGNNGVGYQHFSGFGAEQVVLVRDEHLKEKVKFCLF